MPTKKSRCQKLTKGPVKKIFAMKRVASCADEQQPLTQDSMIGSSIFGEKEKTGNRRLNKEISKITESESKLVAQDLPQSHLKESMISFSSDEERKIGDSAAAPGSISQIEPSLFNPFVPYKVPQSDLKESMISVFSDDEERDIDGSRVLPVSISQLESSPFNPFGADYQPLEQANALHSISIGGRPSKALQSRRAAPPEANQLIEPGALEELPVIPEAPEAEQQADFEDSMAIFSQKEEGAISASLVVPVGEIKMRKSVEQANALHLMSIGSRPSQALQPVQKDESVSVVPVSMPIRHNLVQQVPIFSTFNKMNQLLSAPSLPVCAVKHFHGHLENSHRTQVKRDELSSPALHDMLIGEEINPPNLGKNDLKSDIPCSNLPLQLELPLSENKHDSAFGYQCQLHDYSPSDDLRHENLQNHNQAPIPEANQASYIRWGVDRFWDASSSLFRLFKADYGNLLDSGSSHNSNNNQEMIKQKLESSDALNVEQEGAFEVASAQQIVESEEEERSQLDFYAGSMAFDRESDHLSNDHQSSLAYFHSHNHNDYLLDQNLSSDNQEFELKRSLNRQQEGDAFFVSSEQRPAEQVLAERQEMAIALAPSGRDQYFQPSEEGEHRGEYHASENVVMHYLGELAGSIYNGGSCLINGVGSRVSGVFQVDYGNLVDSGSSHNSNNLNNNEDMMKREYELRQAPKGQQEGVFFAGNAGQQSAHQVQNDTPGSIDGRLNFQAREQVPVERQAMAIALTPSGQDQLSDMQSPSFHAQSFPGGGDQDNSQLLDKNSLLIREPFQSVESNHSSDRVFEAPSLKRLGVGGGVDQFNENNQNFDVIYGTRPAQAQPNMPVNQRSSLEDMAPLPSDSYSQSSYNLPAKKGHMNRATAHEDQSFLITDRSYNSFQSMSTVPSLLSWRQPMQQNVFAQPFQRHDPIFGNEPIISDNSLFHDCYDHQPINNMSRQNSIPSAQTPWQPKSELSFSRQERRNADIQSDLDMSEMNHSTANFGQPQPLRYSGPDGARFIRTDSIRQDQLAEDEQFYSCDSGYGLEQDRGAYISSPATHDQGASYISRAVNGLLALGSRFANGVRYCRDGAFSLLLGDFPDEEESVAPENQSSYHSANEGDLYEQDYDQAYEQLLYHDDEEPPLVENGFIHEGALEFLGPNEPYEYKGPKEFHMSSPLFEHNEEKLTTPCEHKHDAADILTLPDNTLVYKPEGMSREDFKQICEQVTSDTSDVKVIIAHDIMLEILEKIEHEHLAYSYEALEPLVDKKVEEDYAYVCSTAKAMFAEMLLVDLGVMGDA